MDSRQRLISDAEVMLERLRAGTGTPAADVMRVPASAYTDTERFEHERQRVFQRVPLMLAASCELRESGDFKSMDVAGIPLLLVRGKDGVVRTFLNACTHRGARLTRECGRAVRFAWPYHAWTFGLDGSLLGVTARTAFGELIPKPAI
jgi:carnitine monooxygenase subunit